MLFSLEKRSLPHPYFMLLMAPIIWSTSNVIGKFSVGLLSTFQLTFYRWLIAAVVLSVAFYPQIRRDWSQIMAHKGWLFLWGASAFCIFNFLLYGAFALGAKAVNVAIIHSLIPVCTIIFSTVMLKERSHILQWLGILFSLFAVLWLLTHGHLGSLLSWRPSRPDSLILISALIYASYSLALRKAPLMHWSSQMWAMCIAALVVSIPFWLFDILSGTHGIVLEPSHPSLAQWLQSGGIVVYVGVVIAIISKMFYMQGAMALGGSRAALVMNLLPLFSSMMALVVFADERASFGWVEQTALVGVMLGIAFSELGAKRLRLQHKRKHLHQCAHKHA